MTAYTFDQIIDFTRTSAATYVANTGFVTQTPASRNLLTYTQEFDNAAWTKSDATVTANATAAPDGTSTADKLAENTAFAEHKAAQTITVAAGAVTLSVYAKAAERGFLAIRENINGSFVNTFFNLTTGAVVSTGASRTSAITSVGNGWYRCAVTATSAGSSVSCGLDISSDGTNVTYTGTAGSGIFIWGAQLEAASAASTYTRNVGGLYPPRFDYDPVTLAPRGLLIEEQRTNLLTGSADFTATYWPTATNVVVTADNSTSPDGTANADRLADNTTASVQHRIYRDYTFSAGAHTLSVYAKRDDHRWFRLFFFDGTTNFFANFDLLNGAVGNKHASATSSITSAGNGWFRCTLTATAAAAAGNIQMVMLQTDDTGVPSLYTGTGTSLWLYGAQFEAGAFATSYIPTVASQVTRTADVATVTGANFSRWYNQSEGTFVVEADSNSLVAGRFPGMWQVTDGGSPNRIGVYLNQAGGVYVTQRNLSGTPISATTSNSTTQNTVFKGASAYSVSGVSGALNGGAVVNSAVGTPPVVVRMELGLFDGYLNGHIRRIRYYPTRLSNTQLQALTA